MCSFWYEQVDALLLVNVERIGALTVVDTEEWLPGPSNRPDRILSGFHASLGPLCLQTGYENSMPCQPVFSFCSLARSTCKPVLEVVACAIACRRMTGLCTA